MLQQELYFPPDSIYFDGLGGMTHYMNGSTWLEPWQGVSSDQHGAPVNPTVVVASLTLILITN